MSPSYFCRLSFLMRVYYFYEIRNYLICAQLIINPYGVTYYAFS